MPRLADFDKKTRKSIAQAVDAGASALGQDSYEYALRHINTDKLGLCSDCIYLSRIKTNYGKIFAYCREVEIKIKGVDPIKECTKYAKRGALTLNEMQDIAYVIEVNKQRIGFIKEEFKDEKGD